MRQISWFADDSPDHWLDRSKALDRKGEGLLCHRLRVQGQQPVGRRRVSLMGWQRRRICA
jgi:hypothetical protein